MQQRRMFFWGRRHFISQLATRERFSPSTSLYPPHPTLVLLDSPSHPTSSNFEENLCHHLLTSQIKLNEHVSSSFVQHLNIA